MRKYCLVLTPCTRYLQTYGGIITRHLAAHTLLQLTYILSYTARFILSNLSNDLPPVCLGIYFESDIHIITQPNPV